MPTAAEDAVHDRGEGKKLGRKENGPESLLGHFFETDGAAGRNRTHDPLVRSQVLYPAELQPPREANYSSAILFAEVLIYFNTPRPLVD